MFVYYSNGEEVIVTTKSREPEMLENYFENGKRNKDDYNREVTSNSAVVIEALTKVS